MRKTIAAVLTLLLSVNLIAQKTERIKFEGYYNNIPSQRLDISTYSFEFASGISKSFDQKASDINITLDGFEKGDDLRIVFCSTEPQLTPRIVEEQVMVQDVAKTKYTAKLEARANTKIILVNKDNQIIDYFDVEPDYKWIDNEGFDKWSRADAREELKRVNSSSERTSCKNKYVSQSIKAASLQLNKRYGKGAFQEKFRVFTIKPKKFDYTDFNEATQGFINAISTPDINSDANTKAIDHAIATWSNYESQYVDDKSSKVSNTNIDEIYMNLAVGYMVKGDGENLKKYWAKCKEFKGNLTAEGYFTWIVEPVLDNYEQFLAKGNQPLQVIDNNQLLSETDAFNNKVFLNGLFSAYLTSKVNLLYVEDQFAPNYLFLGKHEKTIKHKHSDLTINQTFNYGAFGRISDITFKTKYGKDEDVELLKETQLVHSDTTLHYSFEYLDNQIIEVNSNDKKLFEVEYYEDGLISNVIYYGMDDRMVIFELGEKDENGNIEMRVDMLKTSTRESVVNEKASIKLDADNFISDIRVAPYTTKKRVKRIENGKTIYGTVNLMRLGTHRVEHDANGNVTKFRYSDFADNPVEVTITNTVDEYGNATQSSSNISEVTNTYKYIF